MCFLVLASVLLSGCSVTVHAYGVEAAGEEHTQWNSFFLWGIAGEATVDVAATCGSAGAAAAMGVRENVGTVLLKIFTLGIYSPQIAFVTCGREVAK